MTEPTRPADRAPLDEWRAYASAVDPERAEHIATMNKKALQLQYGRAQQTTEQPPAAPVDPESIPTGPAWGRVMRDVGAIGKDSRNNDQHFNFRGIDATMNNVGPALRAHGVMVLPVGVEVLESERYETRTGAKMHGMVTRHEWLILGPDGDAMRYPDGSPIIMRTLGQAADSGDKVATKAASVAYRTVLLQALTVPTGDPDPDASAHERASEPTTPADPRQEQWDRIAGLAAYAKQPKGAIRKHYKDKMGHEIDSADATVATLTEYADRLHASLAKQAEAENTASGYDAPGAERDSSKAPDQPADDDTAEPEPASAEPEPQQDEPAAPAADPQPQAATGDYRRQMWREIKQRAHALGWSDAQTAADFTAWASDAEGITAPLTIDGPDTTNDHLVRYAHQLNNRSK